MHASLTRRVTFSAAHRYRRPEWDEARNAEVFGKCAWPNWHGHTYVCDVTVGGPIDPLTGFCADLDRLDEILRSQVVDALDHRNLVLDVPEFAEGRLIPTTENIAAWVARVVQQALDASAGSARVQRVRVSEAPDLWAEVVP